MNKTKKEMLERFYLSILAMQRNDLPLEAPTKGECPDFVWTGIEQPLGIEITRLFKDAPQGQRPVQAQESDQRATVELAKQIYEKRNLPNLDIRVIFGNTEIKKSHRKLLASELANLIQHCLPAPDSWVHFDNNFENDSIPEEISYLSIARIENLMKNHWSVSGAGWVQEDFVIELQKKIDEKNSRLSNYLKNCSRCWLLIVAEGTGPSSFFDLNENTARHCYNSFFERTFFMEAFTHKVTELDITKT